MTASGANPRATLTLIAAIDRNRAIGRGNRLPWRLPADLKRFRELTTGHCVIMGRKTHESIGKPLPDRINIVVTRQAEYRAEGCALARDLDEALRIAATRDPSPFVIGGAEIYAQSLPKADRLAITEIDTAVEGADAFFPVIDPEQWRQTEREALPPDEKNPYRYAFVTYERWRANHAI